MSIGGKGHTGYWNGNNSIDGKYCRTVEDTGMQTDAL